jgi:hypothetical protein
MSPSSIVLRITWKQQEPNGLYIRLKVVSLCFVLLFWYLYVKVFISNGFDYLTPLWAISCLLALLLIPTPSNIPHSPITSIPKIANFFIHQMVSWMGYSEQILRQNDESEEFEDVIAMSTLAFNKKQWKKNIGELLSRFRFSRFTVLQLIPAVILACLICVFCVSLCLLWSIVLLYLYLIYKIFALTLALHVLWL